MEVLNHADVVSVEPSFYHDPLPYETQSIHWKISLPIIGFFFHERVQNSLNSLLYEVPPSLQRRMQIYTKQDHYYLYMLLSQFVYSAILYYYTFPPGHIQLGILYTPILKFLFAFYCIEMILDIAKFSFNRHIALKHFGDAPFYGKTLTYIRQ